MRILCVDPGKKTGVAIVVWDGDEVSVEFSDEIPNWNEAGRLIEGLVSQGGVDVIVTEDFVILKKTSGQWSILLNGVVRHTAWKAGIEVVGQNSQRAKTFSKNAKLKALGLWHVGGDGHANDALRHGLLYMATQGFADRRMVS